MEMGNTSPILYDDCVDRRLRNSPNPLQCIEGWDERGEVVYRVNTHTHTHTHTDRERKRERENVRARGASSQSS